SDVTIAGPSPLFIDIFGGSPGEKVILIAGTLGCGALPTPWGGSIDFSGGSVVLDGFGLTTGPLDALAQTPFSLGIGAGPGLPPGVLLGTVQAIVTDPTNAIPLRNTIAAQISTASSAMTVYTLPDDGFVQHTLISAPPVAFCGGSFSQFFIGSNGYITFGAGSSDFSETMGEFFSGFVIPTVTPNPTVAVAYGDFNPGGTTSGSTYEVTEDPFGNVFVDFKNQNHWDGTAPEPAGDFGAIFPNNGGVFGDVLIDLSAYIPATTLIDASIIVGVSDGDSNVGIDTDLSDGFGTGIATNIGTYVSPMGAPDAIGELIPAMVLPGFSFVTFFDQGMGSCEWQILP
ncbi:MAG: hypothetical protein KDB53_17680, partial [Planctomycetes bacterium]|nr:hypothetical protein [Planctomycetota bacterium]